MAATATATATADGAKPPSVEAILDALRRHPNTTAAELATAAGIGRSTAGKALTVLEGEGYVIRRAAEPQQGTRTAPDHWSLSSGTPTGPEHEPAAGQPAGGPQPAPEQPATPSTSDRASDGDATNPAVPDTTEPGSTTAPNATARSANQDAASPRLRPGELRALVHAYLAERPDQELTPTKIGKELGRSAGAVGNALATMTAAGEITQTSTKPRKYKLASQPAAETGTAKAS